MSGCDAGVRRGVALKRSVAAGLQDVRFVVDALSARGKMDSL